MSRLKCICRQILFKPLVVSAAVRGGGCLFIVYLCLILVLLCSSWCRFKFCNQFGEEVRASCFTLIVVLLSCSSWRSVSLLHSAIG